MKMLLETSERLHESTEKIVNRYLDKLVHQQPSIPLTDSSRTLIMLYQLHLCLVEENQVNDLISTNWVAFSDVLT